MTVVTRSAAETRALGEKLGRALRGLDVVCLIGDLGSGKTTFTQGLARGAGFGGRVTSPTFVIAKRYEGKRWRVHHLDLYRVASDGTGDVGIEEYVSDPDGICVIEWPQSGAAYYPHDRLEVHLAADRKDEAKRKLRFEPHGKRFVGLLRRMKA